MSNGLNLDAQQKWAPIMLRFPERSRAHEQAENNRNATILVFPQTGRSSGIPPAMPQHQHIAIWLIFKIRKVADSNWQVRARLGSRDESHYVATFNSERQALEWISSGQSVEWLKKRGYGTRTPAPKSDND